MIVREKTRYDFIMDNLKEKYQYLLDKGYKVMALFLQGSQNYNLDIYDEEYQSDIDAKAIVLPSLEDVILNKVPISTTIILENKEHIEVKDIRVMKDMFIKQNISYIELLYSDYKIINKDYEKHINELLNMRDEIININKSQFLRCIKGMSLEKLKALEHPYPNLIDKINKYGYDPKQLHHIVRLNEFAKRYLIDKEYIGNCYISNKADELIKIKKGCYSLDSARIMASHYNSQTRDICDLFIMKNDAVINENIDNLNSWVIETLKEEFLTKNSPIKK